MIQGAAGDVNAALEEQEEEAKKGTGIGDGNGGGGEGGRHAVRAACDRVSEGAGGGAG